MGVMDDIKKIDGVGLDSFVFGISGDQNCDLLLVGVLIHERGLVGRDYDVCCVQSWKNIVSFCYLVLIDLIHFTCFVISFSLPEGFRLIMK